jgi:cobalt-zinc-cadmium efflux system outer membrane protein
MHRFSAAALMAGVAALGPRAGAAQDGTFTLDQALARARERAPALVAARAQVDEARARLVGASVLLHDNPVVDGAAGPHQNGSGFLTDYEVGVSQTFEVAGQRGARMDGAEAGVARELAATDDATRRVLRDTAAAFLRGLYAAEQLRLAEAAQALAVETRQLAERRHQAGDIAVLDVNVATAAQARARADVEGRRAAQTAALGELRLLLGMAAHEPLALRGDLRDRQRFELGALLERAPERPDLQALQADGRAADADQRLGAAAQWPTVGLGARYHKDQGENVALGGVTLGLPVFERGQGARAEAAARSRRVEFALEAGRREVDVEVRTAFEVYERRAAAVDALERDALPGLDDNQTLARRSYEAGQLSLAEFLLIRRELLGTRVEYVDRLLEAALAGVDLEASAGVLK